MLMKRKISLFIYSLLIAVLVMTLFRGFKAEPRVAVAKTNIPPIAESYDVVVIGSEIQGVLLAKEARNLGLKVMILDTRSKLGGELIQGQMFFLDDVNDNKKRSLVQGEIKNLFTAFKAGSIRNKSEFDAYYNDLIKGIPLQSGIAIDSVTTAPSNEEKTVQSMTFHSKNGVQHRVQAKYWVENTDFNALSSHLNEKRIPGMETISRTKHADYMAATYMLNFKNVQWNKLHQTILKDYPLSNVLKEYGPNTYVNRSYATGFSHITEQFKTNNSDLKLRGLNALNQKNGQVCINALLVYNVDPADPKSVQSAVTQSRAIVPSILAFLRSHMPGFSKAELNGYPEYLYIRDYNRYETKYVLDYKDLTNKRMFWDNVSVGGYNIDLQGTQTIPMGIGFGKPDHYGLPLRSFELKSYDNVLVVGKNVGANIKAYGSARIMPTTALAAQTIGIILGKENKRLEDLTSADFERIHKYLKQDYKITL